jgi:lathosterol oxidase
MDLILKFYDDLVFTPYIYPHTWDIEWWPRQYLSLFVIVTIHSYILYLGMSSLSYFFIFDKKLLEHPKLLKVSIHVI